MPEGTKALQAGSKETYSSEPIRYVGAWSRGALAGAKGHSLSFSGDPGAAVWLRFSGPEIAFVYAKGRDRGIAQIRVDGMNRDDIDLYSAAPVRAQTIYRGLGPGEHTIEAVVSGQKNAAATDRIVDVESFIIH